MKSNNIQGVIKYGPRNNILKISHSATYDGKW